MQPAACPVMYSCLVTFTGNMNHKFRREANPSGHQVSSNSGVLQYPTLHRKGPLWLNAGHQARRRHSQVSETVPGAHCWSRKSITHDLDRCKDGIVVALRFPWNSSWQSLRILMWKASYMQKQSSLTWRDVFCGRAWPGFSFEIQTPEVQIKLMQTQHGD